jgi:ribonucleoside-diphosphate reductase alpha chain
MKYGTADPAVHRDVPAKWPWPAGKSGWRLAKEKGPAPIMDEDFTVTAEMLRKRPEMAKDGYKVGQEIKGRCCTRYSRYMQRVAEVAPELVAELAEVGARFTHHSSIAPTGTISLSLANNASNGIEPSFAHHYSRNVIREGKKSKEKVDVFSFELLAYRELVNAKAMPFSTTPAKSCPTTSSPPTTSPRRSTSISRPPRRSGSIPRSPRPPTCRPTTRTRTSRTSTATPTSRA